MTAGARECFAFLLAFQPLRFQRLVCYCASAHSISLRADHRFLRDTDARETDDSSDDAS